MRILNRVIGVVVLPLFPFMMFLDYILFMPVLNEELSFCKRAECAWDAWKTVYWE